MVKLAPMISNILSLIQTPLDEPIPSERSHIRKALVVFSFLAVMLVATCIIWVNTPFGVNTSHDSLFYLSAAENIAAGRGVFWTGSGGELKPLTHFPPFYPLVLAIFSKFSPPLDMPTRVIAASFFGLNAAIIGLAIYSATRRWVIGILGSLVFIMSPVMLKTHLAAMSEPLFFFMTFTSLVSIALYINKPSSFTLVLASVCSALAVLSRYAGTAVPLTGFICLLILKRKPLASKIRPALAFISLSIGPVLLWMGRNFLLTGSASNRTFVFHPIDTDNIRQILGVIFSWITPDIHSHWLEAVGLTALFVFVFAYAWQQIWFRCDIDCWAPYLIIALQLFAISYVFLLLVSLSFFDASTRMDDRILAPLFLTGLLALMVAVGHMLKKAWHLILPVTLLIIGLIGPLPYMVRQSNEMLLVMRNSGAGFSSPAWRNSQLIQWINSQEDDPIIVTNQAMAVRYLTKIPAYQVPERFDPVKAEVRPDYILQMQSIRMLLNEPHSFMVLFERRDLSMPADADLVEDLELIFTATDGWVYTSKGRGDSLPSP
jgi:hypothetical protein